MTAAHCAKDRQEFRVIAGAHNWHDVDEPHRQEFVSYESVVHPYYGYGYNRNDIALIKLPRPATFNTFVRPACLPSIDDKIGIKLNF